jgi:hypothetical protein
MSGADSGTVGVLQVELPRGETIIAQRYARLVTDCPALRTFL